MPPCRQLSYSVSNATLQTTSLSLQWITSKRPRLTARFRNFYTLSQALPQSSWTPPLHNSLCTASPPPTHLPTLARNSLPTTPALPLHSNQGGSAQKHSAPAKKRPLSLSPPPAPRHRSLHSSHAFLPSPLPIAWSAAYALV